MTAALDNAINRHGTQDYEREALDWYVEPSWCWDVLHACAPVLFTGSVLDPACGGGVGLSWCHAHGVTAMGTDVVDRGAVMAGVEDFLTPDYPYVADAVITNPPYRHMEAFALQALRVARQFVALLTPLPFLCSQRRHTLFTTTPVAGVIILSKRPSMPPGGQGITAKGGKEDYAWIIWRHGHEGLPVIHWAMP
jgi:hypothetical protein